LPSSSERCNHDRNNITPTDVSPDTGSRRLWLILAVLLGGQFMALLDVTIVNVAMPTISTDLHTSGSTLQLIVAGYTVAYAMLLITGARLGTLFGRRRMFLGGMIGFTLSSLVCGLAPDTGVLVAARFVQGAAAAAMVPQIITVIQSEFVGAARARRCRSIPRCSPSARSPGRCWAGCWSAPISSGAAGGRSSW